jgi:hypothetical protein
MDHAGNDDNRERKEDSVVIASVAVEDNALHFPNDEDDNNEAKNHDNNSKDSQLTSTAPIPTTTTIINIPNQPTVAH